MNHHKHRILLGLVKIGTLVAWLAGVPDPIIAAVVTPWACWWAFRIIRDGLRENYLVDPKELDRRHWEDLVWDHTVWVNRETPEEGIERLTAHLQPAPAPQPLRAPHEMAIP